MKQDLRTPGEPRCPICDGADFEWENFLTPTNDDTEVRRCGICKKCNKKVTSFFVLRHLYTAARIT